MTPAPPTSRFALDTGVLVAYVRRGALGDWIEDTYHLRSRSQLSLICVVTEGEIRSLALQRNWGAARQREIQRLIDRFISVPLDFPGVIESYAGLDHFSRQMGRPMGKNDLWIAATARATGATLLTTDRDFDHLYPSWITRDWIDETIVRGS